VIISVKSGNTSAVIRDLRGVVERENAACGFLITRNPRSKPMIQEAKEAGTFKPEMFQPFDKIQIVTIQQILDGERMSLPLMEQVKKKRKNQRKTISRLWSKKLRGPPEKSLDAVCNLWHDISSGELCLWSLKI
jgi:hypothetical protein